MPETSNTIETRLIIPAESVPDFLRVIRTEHRSSILNTASYLLLLGLEEWGRRHPPIEAP